MIWMGWAIFPPPQSLVELRHGSKSSFRLRVSAHEADGIEEPRHVLFSYFSFFGSHTFSLANIIHAYLIRLGKAIDTNRNYPLAHFWLAAALAHLGRLDDARAASQAGLATNPTFTIARNRAGATSDNPTYLAQRERLLDGMRKAGVPEE
jgi:hypothetical protein